MDFSPADHVRAVTRSVATVTRGADEMRLLTVTRTYAATPAEVWDAVVSPDRIARWLAPVTGDLRPGGRFQVEGNAGGAVLECVEPERLSVTWEYGGQTSWVDVSLRPTVDGTVLQLDHTVPVDDHYRQFGPGATGLGWEAMLMGLTLHLESPDAPRPEPHELPDLTDYFRATGTAWGGAAAAGADDPEEARAAAERCVAAYTGEATE